MGPQDLPRWQTCESENFRLSGSITKADGRTTLARLEELRGTLAKRWIGPKPLVKWTPKCNVVLHPTLARYLAVVGSNGRHTIGSALVEHDHGRPTSRRIDVRGDCANWLVETVPHELTHVVLADSFTTWLPAWADEGIAVQADSPAKQDRHDRDFREALASSSDFRLAALFTTNPSAAGTDRAAFYGQSAALVRYLLQHGGSERLHEFVEVGAREGYDRAARRCYREESLLTLERSWRREVTGGAQLASAAPVAAKP